MTNENIYTSQWFSYDEAMEQMKKQLDNVLETSPKVIRKYTKHLHGSKGKNIRASSLLVCAQNAENLIPSEAITLSVSFELLHLATLVHDDVIDNAPIRRGIVTLQKKYGRKIAVICGDYLLCTALKLISTILNREKYYELNIPDYLSKICLGELRQHENSGNLNLSAYQYLKIIAGKTGALFEASFYAGAVLCESCEVQKYRRLGRYIGMIFQLTDDCMDYEMTEETTKKPVRSDFEQGVITLPLIYALKKTSDLKEQCKEKRIKKDEVLNEVKRVNGTGFTHSLSKKYYQKAMTIIDQMILTENKRNSLVSILNKAYG